jgi:hypothetical protein
LEGGFRRPGTTWLRVEPPGVAATPMIIRVRPGPTRSRPRPPIRTAYPSNRVDGRRTVRAARYGRRTVGAAGRPRRVHGGRAARRRSVGAGRSAPPSRWESRPASRWDWFSLHTLPGPAKRHSGPRRRTASSVRRGLYRSRPAPSGPGCRRSRHSRRCRRCHPHLRWLGGHRPPEQPALPDAFPHAPAAQRHYRRRCCWRPRRIPAGRAGS